MADRHRAACIAQGEFTMMDNDLVRGIAALIRQATELPDDPPRVQKIQDFDWSGFKSDLRRVTTAPLERDAPNSPSPDQSLQQAPTGRATFHNTNHVGISQLYSPWGVLSVTPEVKCAVSATHTDAHKFL